MSDMLLTKLQRERVEDIVFGKNISTPNAFEVELMIRYIQEQSDRILTLEIEASENNEFANPN